MQDPGRHPESIEFNRILAVGLSTVWQPIVSLGDRSVRGYEGLSRGPEGSLYESPLAIISHARTAERLPETDWAMMASALERSTGSLLPSGASLLVNSEIASAPDPIPEQIAKGITWHCRQRRVIVELTERDVGRSPTAVATRAEEFRRLGALIAIDDMGGGSETLDLLEVVQPEFIKLDLQLFRTQTRRDRLRVLDALASHPGEIIAERIERAEDLEEAEAAGASFGQGYLFAEPSPEPPHPSGHALIGL